MEANVNMVQVLVALNQGMISSYHLVHGRVGQEAQLAKSAFMHVDMGRCVCGVTRGDSAR